MDVYWMVIVDGAFNAAFDNYNEAAAHAERFEDEHDVRIQIRYCA